MHVCGEEQLVYKQTTKVRRITRDVTPQFFGDENPSPCTFEMVPRSVAIAYRSHHRG
jgi:hypothetical protein